jgi:hypothetical protein
VVYSQLNIEQWFSLKTPTLRISAFLCVSAVKSW